MDMATNLPASARPPQQLLVSETGTIKPQCEAATRQQGKAELGGCLTLVSPSGLTPADRAEWIAVAMQDLSGIPADLLTIGCAAARKRCKFPSEIVPAIYEEIGQRWEWRKTAAKQQAPLPVSHRIEAPRDEGPITLHELRSMPRNLVEMARRQGWVEPDVLAQFDGEGA